MSNIKDFIVRNFRHFNSATLIDAARNWQEHLDGGGKMFLSMAGAMSTAEIGTTLAELIRRGKVHAVCCTGANLEEDLFNLVAHESYLRIPHYRDLSAADEVDLLKRGMNRVTDTCIPENEAIRVIESAVLERWQQAERLGECHPPHEYLYQLLREDQLKADYDIDPEDSWLRAAAKKDLPLFVPGWEDSTLGNLFVASVLKGKLAGYSVVSSGLEQMARLVSWYRETDAESRIGFFQIGGGIAGDFSICVVPLINQDLHFDVRHWSYFCQISDSTTSYGSYSGAPPNEKITWGKLEPDTPRFIIESDATIVFPLIAAYLLDL